MKTVTTLYLDAEVMENLKKKQINVSAAFREWLKTQNLDKLKKITDPTDGRLKKLNNERCIEI
ncbi:MAG: hypothetical protein PHV93_04670 [Candidatus Pacebacteria bacterium]|nr:hypothetical protein [Candidatus Paceibacterota bacterium]